MCVCIWMSVLGFAQEPLIRSTSHPTWLYLLRAQGSTVSSVTLFGRAVPENAASSSSSNSWGPKHDQLSIKSNANINTTRSTLQLLSLSLFQSLTSMTVASHVRPTHPQRAFPHSKPCYSICPSALSSPGHNRPTWPTLRPIYK